MRQAIIGTGAVGVLPLYGLATRATPAGMMSARNVAVCGADALGSWLIDHHLPWDLLVGLNGGTTLLCLLVLPLLPRTLTLRGDEARA